MSMTLRWQATEAIIASVALPVPCMPMSTIDARESNILRHSYCVGAGVDLAEFGRLRCLDAGGDGVGSEARPSIAPFSVFIAANERFAPTVMEAIVYGTWNIENLVPRCQQREAEHGAAVGSDECLSETRDSDGPRFSTGIKLYPGAQTLPRLSPVLH